jgi:hypothetical protein
MKNGTDPLYQLMQVEALARLNERAPRVTVRLTPYEGLMASAFECWKILRNTPVNTQKRRQTFDAFTATKGTLTAREWECVYARIKEENQRNGHPPRKDIRQKK